MLTPLEIFEEKKKEFLKKRMELSSLSNSLVKEWEKEILPILSNKEYEMVYSIVKDYTNAMFGRNQDINNIESKLRIHLRNKPSIQ